jgi:hypothetical protein
LDVPQPRNPTRSTAGTEESEPEIVEVSVDETSVAPERLSIGQRDRGHPGRPTVTAGVDIRWTEDGACIVELRGRPTRPMLAKARDLLWSRSAQDRLTIVVSDAVLTRELFAMLIAGRRRLSASGVLEIVGLDAPGARRIADSLPRPT